MTAGLTNRVFRWETEGRRGYVGAALYTYQLTLGVTLRWYFGQPHVRFYVGPLKLYAGFRADPFAAPLSGGDR